MHDLEAWFSEKDYSTGVMLYSKYGKYKRVLFLLQKGETELNRSKLLDCLNRLRTTVKQEVEARTKAVGGINSPPVSGGVAQGAGVVTDEIILKLDAKWKPLYGEMAMLHSRLLAVESKEARYSLAMRISDIHSELVGYWEQISYYKKHGKLPEKTARKKVRDDITPNDLRKLMTTRTALTNYEKHRLTAAMARLNAEPTAKNKTNLERTQKAIEKYKKTIADLEKKPEI